MGTRGYVIIKIDNKYYAVYNHSDSYPEDLGKKIVYYLSKFDINDDFMYFYSFFKNISPKEEVFELPLNEITYRTMTMIEWFYLLDIKNKTLKIIGGYYKPVYDVTEFRKDNFDIENWISVFSELNQKYFEEHIDVEKESFSYNDMNKTAPDSFIKEFL